MNPRQAVLDALTAERFTYVPRPVPVDPQWRAHRAAIALPTYTTCAGCGTRVPADAPCPTCRAYRLTRERRARLRAV